MSLSHLQSLFTNVWAIFLVVLFFGGSIFVHELGHFLAARRRGVKVTRFSIGFGPKIASWVRDGVEWRISWLPLGGYVALPQLADMSEIEGADPEVDVAKLPPVSYASKMIVFGAGAAFNVIFAFVLATIIWIVGVPADKDGLSTRIGDVLPSLTVKDAAGGTKEMPGPAKLAGLESGDVVVAIDGKPVSTWTELQQTLFTSTGRTSDDQRRARFTVVRDGRTLELEMNPQLSESGMRMVGITPAIELVIASATGLAKSAGFESGDRIVTLDGRPVFGWWGYANVFSKDPKAPVPVTVQREDQLVELAVADRSSLDNPALFGLEFTSGIVLVHRSPWVLIGNIVRDSARSIWAIIHPHSDVKVSDLSSPLGIAHGLYLTAKADFRLVLWFAVLINVSLAIFNLLPIPVLDGGHMLFATLARLRGRPLPTTFVMAAQSVVMVMLLCMIVYVMFFDAQRIARGFSEPEHAGETKKEAPASPQSEEDTEPAPASP